LPAPQPQSAACSMPWVSAADRSSGHRLGISLFFSVVPSNLTGAQAKALIARLAPAEGQSLDQILASLKADLTSFTKLRVRRKQRPARRDRFNQPAPANQPGRPARAQSTSSPDLPRQPTFPMCRSEGAVARWGAPDKDEISGTIRGITSNKVLYIGRYSASDPGAGTQRTVLRVRFISATPMVDKHRNVVIPAAKNRGNKHGPIACRLRGESDLGFVQDWASAVDRFGPM